PLTSAQRERTRDCHSPVVFYLAPPSRHSVYFFFFFNATASTEIYTLSLHDALPIFIFRWCTVAYALETMLACVSITPFGLPVVRSEEHTSELQSLRHLVCRLLLEKKKNKT